MVSLYPEKEGFVRVEGHRIFYRSLGRPLRGSVLVVHGGPSDHRYLASLADLVPHGFRVVWFDQWGCGRSDRPRSFRGYTMEAAGAEVVDVANALRLRSPHLFGHSWGGALALQAVTRAPHRFGSVAVCGGFASDRSFGRAMRRHIHTLPAAIRDPIEEGEREGRYDGLAYRAAVRRRRREFSLGMKILPFDIAVTESSSINRRLLRAVYGERPGLLSPVGGMLRGWDVRPQLRQVALPCLVLAGDLEAGRYTAREIHRLVRGSRLSLLRNCAHFPFLQSRDRFTQALLAFLSRPGRGRARTEGTWHNVLNEPSPRAGR